MQRSSFCQSSLHTSEQVRVERGCRWKRRRDNLQWLSSHSSLYSACLWWSSTLYSAVPSVASQVAQWERICLQNRRCRFDLWVETVSWRRQWQPAPVFLPGKPHAQRSLAGYSPWGRKETAHVHTCSQSTGNHRWISLEKQKKETKAEGFSCPQPQESEFKGLPWWSTG